MYLGHTLIPVLLVAIVFLGHTTFFTLKVVMYIHKHVQCINSAFLPGRNFTVELMPSIVNGNAGKIPINLTCIPKIMENVTLAVFQFTWMKDLIVINQSDRINV